MMKKCMMGNMFKHHYIHCLNKQEKICMVALIGCSFIKGIFVGMYLSEK